MKTLHVKYDGVWYQVEYTGPIEMGVIAQSLCVGGNIAKVVETKAPWAEIAPLIEERIRAAARGFSG